jgi:chemotaxis protein CheX
MMKSYCYCRTNGVKHSMTATSTITNILNSTIDSVKTVIPAGIRIEKPVLFSSSSIRSSLSVLIGVTGEVQGRLVIEGNKTIFGAISELMYGMQLEGEMLESFTCELGNMIAGNLATHASKRQVSMDITPPTLLIGETMIRGFSQAIAVPIDIAEKGKLNIILMIEQN